MSPKKNIIVVGNLPPPIGGVSIYVRRRIRELEGQGYNVIHVPSRPSLGVLIKFLFAAVFCSAEAIEVNSTHIQWPILLRLACPFTKIIVIDHNDSRRFFHFSALKRVIYGIGYLMTTRIDLVRMTLADHYKKFPFYNRIEFGFRKPFILPDEKEEQMAVSNWPEAFLQFFDHGTHVISCAYKLDDNNDIYRFRDILTAFADVSIFDKSLKLILSTSLCESAYEESLKAMIQQYGLESKVYLNIGPLEIWPAFKKAKLMLRITTTDGDSVSVNEALAMGCRVIASDVVPRPEGVILVPLNNIERLSVVIKKILGH